MRELTVLKVDAVCASKVSQLNRYSDVETRCKGRLFLGALLVLFGMLPGAGASMQVDEMSAKPLGVGEAVYLSALPFYRDMDVGGVDLVIDLRYPYEGVYEELGTLRSQGIHVLNIRSSSKGPTLDNVKRLEDELAAAAGRRVLIHDSNGHRTAALWGAYRLWKGESLDRVLEDLRSFDDSPELRRKLERFHRELIADEGQ